MELSPELQDDINEVKKRGHKVFRITLGEQKFIYRSVNRKEFRDLQEGLVKTAGSVEAGALKLQGEEDLVAKALIYPKVLSKVELSGFTAGSITTLFEKILAASDFGSEAVEPEQL